MRFLERKLYRTPRQQEIKDLMLEGYSAKEIAERFNIKETTVYQLSHRANKRRKNVS